MKIGDKIHFYWKQYGKLINEWDGVIVSDCSYFGDGKRKLWGVDRIKDLKDWNKMGSIVANEEDLVLLN